MLCDTVVTVRCFEVCKTSKLPARTCKKLPVASFCASETAETGRIANGCEQGDHVSRRKGAIARTACCPDRGMLSMQWKVSEREMGCYFLRRAKSNTKSTRGKPCDPGSKLYGKIFFVTFLTFVPKPVYGATRFFGCFEPVRKGYCSADARPLFFENGML